MRLSMKGFKEYLREMPQVDWEELSTNVQHSPISKRTISRKYDFISDYNGYRSYLSTDKTSALLVVDSKDDEYVIPVVKLWLKADGLKLGGIMPKKYSNIDILQVSKVEGTDKYEGQGFASRLYKSIVDSGYILVSDVFQYMGGVLLWKRLAKKERNVDVYVLDASNGTLYSDEKADAIKYDGRNIPDSEIWKTSAIGMKKVLILVKK